MSLEHPVRIEPIPTEDWDDDVRAAMEVLPEVMRPQPGTTINSLSVLAHNPPLAAAQLTYSNYFRFHSTIPGRARELLIMRLAWLRGGLYELIRHARNAKREGIDDDEIRRIGTGSAHPDWNADDRLLMAMVEDLCADHRIGDATWAALGERYSTPEIMDMVFLVGCYDGMAMAFNSFGVQPEADLPPYPGELPAGH